MDTRIAHRVGDDSRPFNAPVLVGVDGRPLSIAPTDRCPHCGAGSDQRVRSGMGQMREVTCQVCAFEFPKELA